MLFLNAHHAIANMLSLVRVRTGAWPEAADLRNSYLRELAGSLGLSLTVGPEINVAFEENPLAKTAAQQALFAGEGQSLGSSMAKRAVLAAIPTTDVGGACAIGAAHPASHVTSASSGPGGILGKATSSAR